MQQTIITVKHTLQPKLGKMEVGNSRVLGFYSAVVLTLVALITLQVRIQNDSSVIPLPSGHLPQSGAVFTSQQSDIRISTAQRSVETGSQPTDDKDAVNGSQPANKQAAEAGNFQVFRNVCLHPVDNQPLNNRTARRLDAIKAIVNLRAYDWTTSDTQDVAVTSRSNTIAVRNTTTAIPVASSHRPEPTVIRFNIHNKKRNHWLIHHHSVNDVPENLTFIDKAAYFPRYWRIDVNTYIYLDRMVPFSYLTLAYNRQYHLGNGSVLIAIDTSDTIPEFRQMHLDIGMSKIYELSDVINGTEPLCFSHGVFPYFTTGGTARKTVSKLLSKTWGLDTLHCPDPYVLFLERNSTRRLHNLDEIIVYLRQHNISPIKVAMFEGKSAKEQASIVHCAKVFIAVQGAGMNWYKFLPHNASMLEITYNGWRSHYRRRAIAYRPDVIPLIVKCEMYTPPHIFLKFARAWMNFTGTADDITAESKAELLERSLKMDSVRTKNIQKDSDAVCDPRAVYEHIVDKL